MESGVQVAPIRKVQYQEVLLVFYRAVASESRQVPVSDAAQRPQLVRKPTAIQALGKGFGLRELRMLTSEQS
jgi:hypothetical protein